MFNSANKFTPKSLQNKSRIKIKSFEVKREDPEKLYAHKWPILHKCILAVFAEQKADYNHEVLYRHVGDLCRKHMEERLYSDVRSVLVQHIANLRQMLDSDQKDTFKFLRTFVSLWLKFENHITIIRNIFLVLDRNYVLHLNGPIKSIWDMALDLFRTNIVQVHHIRSKLTDILLELINAERNGNEIDTMQLTTCLSMLSHLQVYDTVFQTPLIQRTNQYYTENSTIQFQDIEQHSTTNSSADAQHTTIEPYIQWVLSQIAHEEYRATHYYKPATRLPLINTVYQQLVANYSQQLLDFGFESLLNQNKVEHLKNLHNLLKYVHHLDALKSKFYQYIVKYGTMIVKDQQRDENMVQDLLDFKKNISHVHEMCFQNSPLFNHTIKDAFIEFINSRPKKPAEMVAKFLDRRLQKGNKHSEQELEEIMDNAMIIFKYIRETDVFEAFYKKDLAKRLLLDRSASSDVEKAMLSKLKAECGGEFTRKLEGMFKDMEANKTLMSDFLKREDYTSAVSEFDAPALHVHVITTGNWPAYQSCSLNLPPEIAQSQKMYQSYYLSKFSGRKLTWQNHLGRCTLLARFPQCGEKTLDVSLFQASVLVLFNDETKLTYTQIKDALQLEEPELKRTLLSLACARVQPLRKKPSKTKEILPDDEFHFNNRFQNPKMKIRINTIQMRETKKEQEETTEKILVERHYVIDAAIVRIMKARKQLQHQQLLAEVVKTLKFPASFQDIKKRVESLLEREYLMRGEDLSTLVYCS
eukprot:CAMPEP_0117441388 /NCGR_PEP_ID=MMETSP0759-20121206/3610_1 /TAXON_ID=63605 /ORGANISM="Percolomonas cosmopolitus, Strain WS" /LENGTH=753 /DNA_ID=CAMNT_0005233243 /DNA_START=47 /DNA_END=2308 /DNA_ORIENTATION=-